MHYMHRKYQIFFLFGILIAVFLNVNSLPALTTSSGVVNFSKSWLSSDPQNGVTYKGTRELIPPAAGSMETRKLLHSESWNPSKPSEIITYTLTSRVMGQGVILMSISGQTTKSHDVGSFRPTDVRPTSLTVERDFYTDSVEKYTNLRPYVEPYVPSQYDTYPCSKQRVQYRDQRRH